MAYHHPDILRPDYFAEPFGAEPLKALSEQVALLNPESPEAYSDLPELMVGVQSYNHSPRDIDMLTASIADQHYPPEKVHKVLLSAENDPETEKVARRYGMEVVPVEPGKSFRADLLNKAVEVADSNGIDTIYTTVGHAVLSNRRLLQVASAYPATYDSPALAYGVALPKGGTWPERAGAVLLGAKQKLEYPHTVTKDEKGITASDCSVISARIVKGLGGYNPAYGLGGADGEMARRM